jgi:hypothetical protein
MNPCYGLKVLEASLSPVQAFAGCLGISFHVSLDDAFAVVLTVETAAIVVE